MTSTNVETKNIYGISPITEEHIDNNIAVREMLRSRGSAYPQDGEENITKEKIATCLSSSNSMGSIGELE